MQRIPEDGIEGLEAEIDSAVDRIFVDKSRVRAGLSDEKEAAPLPALGSSYDMEVSLPSPPLLESLDRMETQLLSLEWEITKENLKKTKEEVAALKEISKLKPDIIHVLGLMERVLERMMRREGDIRPSMIKFLLDAKETVRLLARQEIDGEINTYKQLAFTGIETRFSRLNDGEKGEESGGIGEPEIWNRMAGLVSRMTALEEKVEGILKDREIHPGRFGGQGAGARGRPVKVTVFRVSQRLFGVESDKVYKLFKISNGIDRSCLTRQKVRLKDFEARIIDLQEILSIGGKGENQERGILIVRDSGEYKGLIVDQIIRKSLSGREETGCEQGEYFSGAIRCVFQGHPVEVPILDLNMVTFWRP